MCDYRLKSEGNDDVTIDLELMSFNRILCDDGLEIYDGKITWEWIDLTVVYVEIVIETMKRNMKVCVCGRGEREGREKEGEREG